MIKTLCQNNVTLCSMQALPGFRDFLPEDCARRNYIFARWREVARRYGFVEWEGPPLEATELYKKKSGAEIVEQLFNFTDKGEREVALRPELTPTLARVVAAHEREFKKPLKWFSIGQFFRYEKQQRGRLREHFQLNCDIIGEKDLAADIELVALCIDILRAFGFTEKDFVVRISDREFWTDFFRDKNVPAERWDDLLQAIDKSAREPREKTAEKLGDLADPVFATLKSGGKSAKLEQLVEGLRARGLADFVAIDVGIVRGLAYYTGIVFEVFDRAGKFRAIAGGGRYDNLIAQLSDGARFDACAWFCNGRRRSRRIDQRNPASTRSDAESNSERQQDRHLRRYRKGTTPCRRARTNPATARPRLPHRLPAHANQSRPAVPIRRRFGCARRAFYGDEWPQVKIKNMGTGEQELVAHDRLLAHLQAQSTLSS